MTPVGTLFCFGLGYSAMALARRLNVRGWKICGTCQKTERRDALSALGIEATTFDGNGPMDKPSLLQNATHVLLSIPPNFNNDPALHYHANDLMKVGSVKWVGYLSTTGVYGNQNGNWVNETSSLRPSHRRSQLRVKAETAWRKWGKETGIPTQIFRLAGIYGPGRSVFDQIKTERARRIARPGHYFSRIHVEDIATVLSASMAKPEPDTIYNVCDDEPAEASAVIAYAFELLGRKPPPEIALENANLSAMAESFWLDNKRVENHRIKERLGVDLAFPNYRLGLRGIVSG